MRYFYVVMEGGGVKGGTFARTEGHLLERACLSRVLTDFARKQSMASGLLVKPEALIVSFFSELEESVARSCFPKDFEPTTKPLDVADRP
jgi:hypothetical protein